MQSVNTAKRYALDGGAEPTVRKRLAKIEGQRAALDRMMTKVTGT